MILFQCWTLTEHTGCIIIKSNAFMKIEPVSESRILFEGKA